MNVMEVFYRVRDGEPEVWGDHWCYKEPAFPYGGWSHIAHYDKANGDGQEVEVYCCAMPTRFYRIVACAGPNSVGEPQPFFALETGSGKAKLSAMIAEAIAEGMLGLGKAESV